MPPLMDFSTMDTQEPKMLNLDEVRAKLADAQGPEYWRSLEEVAQTPEFEAWLEDEFPNRRSIAEIDRRSLLKLMGASMMLAGLGGCRSLFLPTEKVVPYVKMPEDLIPGIPMQFATAMAWNGSSIGLVVESHEGRPTKIEGNPLHPASMGRSNHFAQAAILNLYDPDRLSGVTRMGEDSSWEFFLRAARAALDEQKATGGAGIGILTPITTSPTLISQIARLQRVFPGARWAQYSPVHDDNVRAGLQMATGEELTPLYQMDKADVILSLDGDFLQSMPDSIRMARDYATRREVWNADVSNLNRLYVVESGVTITGGMADHRLAVRPETVELFARALATRLGVAVGDAPNSAEIPAKWLDALTSDLTAHRGAAVVVAGPQASPAVHALAAAMNQALGAIGATVTYQAPLSMAKGNTVEGYRQFIADCNDGKIKALFILGGNPAFDGPADAPFVGAMKTVPFSACLSTHANETTELVKWRLAESHFLEAWGDVRGYDGTATIQQPLINPLRDTKSAIEVLDLLLSGAGDGHALVQSTWKEMAPAEFGKTWDGWLNSGVIDLAILKQKSGAPIRQGIDFGPVPKPNGNVAIVMAPDPTIWDGEWANNAWLQELPKPMTTLTWDNAALMGAKMIQDLGVRDGDHVKVTEGSKEVTIPALLAVGMPDNTVMLHYGNGRSVVGNVGTNAGTNVYPLRTSASTGALYGTVEKASGRTDLALTQTHHSMEGREIVKVATVDAFAQDTRLVTRADEEAAEGMNMYPPNEEEFPFDGAQWGMTIDLNTCIGCHACVTACQSENNIPVVGKDQVLRGREMHWIRIDRYYRTAGIDPSDKGVMSKNVPMDDARDITDPSESKKDVLDPNRIQTVFAPVTCMHCEKAPCEPVCPVAATVHSHEGLNQMVYNRCVGTRYCSNNCPYKVRRFNFLNYTDNQAQFAEQRRFANAVFSSDKNAGNGRDMLRMVGNPNVTVRGRGVMEKCTYCVQRLNHARIEAKKENRGLRDGDVLTACQQACPTSAIIFGNIADPKSRVTKTKADPRNFSMLPQLNTVNRTTYLARLRNPNRNLENA
ncbi:MAG: TAT-variant-translocated molybdopterin oxidoreductase [Armatimonadetes bacterium]|nr:TAT-variant-translocated molybdopterin oxidoreductase [Armatimonadota bacterium]